MFRPLTAVPVAVFALACSLHVEHPRIVPRGASWQVVGPAGITLRVVVAAYNPNPFDLPLHDLQASVHINGVQTAASVADLTATLPPLREIPVMVELTIPWSALPDIAEIAVTRPALEYQVDGSITVEHYFSVRSAFTYHGTVASRSLINPRTAAVLNAFRHEVLGREDPPPSPPPAASPVPAP